MDELSEQLGRILSDPAQMAQIESLAASLGLGSPSAGEEPSSPAAAPEAAALGKLLPLLAEQSGREAQLFAALRPYLSEENQRRVDRAIRAAKLSRLAKLAVRQLGSGALSEPE